MTQAIATRTAPPDDDPARPEAVDEVALDRNQPGLDQNEEREGHLDGRPAPVEFGVDRIDEQRPAVLEVRDTGHADDADDQLRPWIRQQ